MEGLFRAHQCHPAERKGCHSPCYPSIIFIVTLNHKRLSLASGSRWEMGLCWGVQVVCKVNWVLTMDIKVTWDKGLDMLAAKWFWTWAETWSSWTFDSILGSCSLHWAGPPLFRSYGPHLWLGVQILLFTRHRIVICSFSGLPRHAVLMLHRAALVSPAKKRQAAYLSWCRYPTKRVMFGLIPSQKVTNRLFLNPGVVI